MSDAGVSIPFSFGDIGIPSLTTDPTATDTSVVPSVSDIVAGALAPTSVSPVDLSSLITGVPSVDTTGQPTDTTVSSGSDYQSIVNALPSLAKLGVNTYASVLAAQQNPSAYLATQQPAQVVQPTTTDVTTSAVSPLSTLFDFSQPWPYLLIGGAVLIVVASSKKKR